jgi:hypothetical protein
VGACWTVAYQGPMVFSAVGSSESAVTARARRCHDARMGATETGVQRPSVDPEVFGLHVSLGGIHRIEKRATKALEAPVMDATEHALDAIVKHVDATTWRQAGDFRNLWTMATKLVTVFAITASGTREALQEFVTRVKGILVSDRAAQFTFWAMAHRQICWAHLARRFVELAQRDGEAGRIGESLVLLTRDRDPALRLDRLQPQTRWASRR